MRQVNTWVSGSARPSQRTETDEGPLYFTAPQACHISHLHFHASGFVPEEVIQASSCKIYRTFDLTSSLLSY